MYLEGGPHLRLPMGRFIRQAVGGCPALRVVTCGPRSKAISRFTKEAGTDQGSLLLIDSEGDDLSELTSRVTSAIGLGGVTNSVFFMVELMEAWFLTDVGMVERYFGNGFRPGQLPRNPSVEAVSKEDVLNGLHSATRQCQKGAYNKGAHAAHLLERLDPTTVYRYCPNFSKLIDHIRRSVATA